MLEAKFFEVATVKKCPRIACPSKLASDCQSTYLSLYFSAYLSIHLPTAWLVYIHQPGRSFHLRYAWRKRVVESDGLRFSAGCLRRRVPRTSPEHRSRTSHSLGF